MKLKRNRPVLRLILSCVLLGAVSPAAVSAAEPDAPSMIDNVLGGVVTSAKGPEAGVWVIAETTDLPTKFAKIVVTDDQRPLPHPGPAESELQRLGPRLRARRFAEGPSRARARRSNLKAVVGPERRAPRRNTIRPAIWYSLLQVPDKSEFPGTGPKGNGMPQPEEPGRNGSTSSRPTAATPAISSATRRRATIPEGPRHVRLLRRSLGAAHPVRTGQAQMIARIGRLDTRARLRACSPTGPIASPPANCRAAAAAPAGRRAQRRHHDVGLGDAQGLSARRDRHRQAQSHRQRQRPDLRRARREHRLRPGPRSRPPHGEPGQDAGARSEDAVVDGQAAAAVALLGRRGDLGQPDQHRTIPMFDEKGRVWFTARVRPPDNPAFCKEGSDHPSAKLFPLERVEPPARDVRPEDRSSSR